MTGAAAAGGAAPAVGRGAGTAPARAGLVLISLILVESVANLNLAVANVALPDIGKAFDSGYRQGVRFRAGRHRPDRGRFLAGPGLGPGPARRDGLRHRRPAAR